MYSLLLSWANILFLSSRAELTSDKRLDFDNFTYVIYVFVNPVSVFDVLKGMVTGIA